MTLCKLIVATIAKQPEAQVCKYESEYYLLTTFIPINVRLHMWRNLAAFIFSFFLIWLWRVWHGRGVKMFWTFVDYTLKFVALDPDPKLHGFTNHVTSFQGFSYTRVNRPIIDHLRMIEQLFISSSYVLHFECYL